MSDLADEPCEILPWDTSFFGQGIARVRGDTLCEGRSAEIESWCEARQVRCLYFVARTDDPQTVRLAERGGYMLTDLRVTLASRFAHPDPLTCGPAGSTPIRDAVAGDLPELRRIARESHTDTRFFYDHHFGREKAESLYEAWIQSSFDGYAQAVLVAGDLGKPVGYATCHVSNGVGSIGLVAVDAASQGKGIGRDLLRGTRDWFAGQRVENVSVVTQGRNLPAQRLYVRAGFIPLKVELYYHRWFTPRPRSA